MSSHFTVDRFTVQALPTVAPTFAPTSTPTSAPTSAPTTSAPTTSAPTLAPDTTSAPTVWTLSPTFSTTRIKVAKYIPIGCRKSVANYGSTLIEDGSVSGRVATVNPTKMILKNGTDLSVIQTSIDVFNEVASIYQEVRYWNCPPVQLDSLPTGSILTGPFLGGFYCGKDMYIPDYATVILDANNDPSSAWFFSFSTRLSTVGFSTGKRSAIVLNNGGDPNLVFWVIQIQAILGFYSQFMGNMVVGGPIFIRSGALIRGRSFSSSSVNMYNFARYLPVNYVLNDQSVALGSCSVFAIHSIKSVTFSTVENYVDIGSVGVSPGTSATGDYIINYGTTQTGISTTAVSSCATASTIALNVGITTKCQTRLATSILPSSIKEGVYCSDLGPLTIPAWTTIVLDGDNKPSSLWYFQSASTIITGVHATVVLKNGGLISNVYWFAETDITLGSSTAMIGNVYAAGLINFNSYSRLEGRALSQSAITFDGQNYASTSYNFPNYIDVGHCFYLSVEGGPSIIFSGLGSIIGGWMGVSPGTTISGSYTFKSGGNAYLNTLLAQNCMTSLKAAINRAGATICTNDIVSGDLSNLVLPTGVYCSSSGSLSMSSFKTLTLDGAGVSSSTWLFQAVQSITLSSSTTITLVNNARSENVFWTAGGTTFIGASSSFQGTILSYGAITFGDLTRIDGRALSVGTVKFLGATIATLPPNTIPTGQPTSRPSTQPTGHPSGQPSGQPTTQPSRQPTSQPTTQPSGQPTSQPTTQPTGQPTRQPTHPTGQPTGQPSTQPSSQPSSKPTSPTGQPSAQPSSQPTGQPSGQPSRQPTSQPTGQPSRRPTGQPTRQPTSQPTGQPTRQPTGQPTAQPSSQPSSQPIGRPSGQPTGQPTRQPTAQPTGQPTRQPTGQPTGRPTGQPSSQPTGQPTCQPTGQPSSQPSMQPTGQPTRQPTAQPTGQPTSQPSGQPTSQPSGQPTMQPSTHPSGQPSSQPTGQPTSQPTAQPISQPTGQPTDQPTGQPTGQPVAHPSSQPSGQPSSQPTGQPTDQPTGQPTGLPVAHPSSQPSSQPTGQPTDQPTGQPTSQPSEQPTSQPSGQPTIQPSSCHTSQPSGQPTDQPSSQPTGQPTNQPTNQPTAQPIAYPSSLPTSQPTQRPTHPTSQPTAQPSVQPTTQPTSNPTTPTPKPTSQPSKTPTSQPSGQPTSPTGQPSGQPSRKPSSQPTSNPTSPTGQPSGQPTSPTGQPSGQPSRKPSSQPTSNPTSPTGQPSGQPTSPTGQPSGQPSRKPSSQPTSNPSSPTREPFFVFSPLPLPSGGGRGKRVYTASPTFQTQKAVYPTTPPTYAPTHIPTLSPISFEGSLCVICSIPCFVDTTAWTSSEAYTVSFIPGLLDICLLPLRVSRFRKF